MGIVKWHNNNHFEINYLLSAENWNFYRLHGVNVRQKSDRNIKREIRERAKTANCPDKRSPEEIKRDSIERELLKWEF